MATEIEPENRTGATGRTGPGTASETGTGAGTGSRAKPPTLTVDELAARTGVTVRTIRFYSSRGLLPPPVIGPRRVGRYGPEHLSRLALIEELQQRGMTLAAIERYLERLPPGLSPRDLAIHRALVASWAPDSPEDATRAELERRAGRALAEDDIDRLAAMGALARADRPDTYRLDPALLRLCVELLDVPITQETILAARTVLLEHTREAARKLTRMFRDEVSLPYGPGAADPEQLAAVKSLSAHMEPLVVQALITAFQRSLKEELRTAFQEQEQEE
ncbi:MerR family transcriptional regulator [Streptomyces odonnellii]|uniref:MerR family transcriptional regulator n=1 Tax=Streptomyces odonnellii TaxID=1417980 RepID=UPI00099CD313|nr:MerR family transcriptional regulator [Streptomyces odonnellii]